MSENVSTGKKSRKRYDKSRLPTPPPLPIETKEEKTDDRDDFLAYLDSLQKSTSFTRSNSVFAPVIAAEDAFDHLEKLYKLMEQLLELKEQNARLHRKVRDLEYLNNLEKLHKEFDLSQSADLEKDTSFAETILESILSDSSKAPKAKSVRLRQSIYRKRNRSGSMSNNPNLDGELKSDRRASTCVDSRLKTAKVSKWTKVKAAFKWEKASPTVSDAKSQDSGIAGMVPVNLEVARYLRVPSTSEEGHSPADSGAAEISTPGTLSTASSTEEFQRLRDSRSPCEDLRSSDDEHSHNYIPHSKSGSQKSNKSHKTPWAKMKDIIQTRNSLKKKYRLSGQSDDIQIDVEPCTDNEDAEGEGKKTFSSPKLSSRIYQRVDSSEVPPEVVARYQQAASEDGSVVKVSKWTRVKKAFLPPPENTTKSDENKIIQEEIKRDYQQLQKKLNLEFQEKISEWERMKQNSPCSSNPSSAGQEWQKNKSQPVKKNIQLTSEDLAPEFRKKLQEWEKIRKLSGKENTSKRKLNDVPRWKSLSHRTDNSSEQAMSEDFRKKLEEWKQIKAGNVQSSPNVSRKDSSPKYNKKQKETREKELQWFEKELSKIDKEKQRLERERQKLLEREERLSRLRNSVLAGLKKEVLIHTPSGFYRFEGISRKFTQKLYEWEKSQGIGPESSTFALLSSSLSQDKKPYKQKSPGNTPPLVRSKSADSFAVSALNLACPLMSQPSSLSLNDVDDLEKEVMADSKSSSIHFLDEPEALIVEVEDIFEQTAAPIHSYAEKIQQPVYQREEIKVMCEGETCVGPKIRRSESARAQNNYNLIEEILSILNNLTENELEIQKAQELMGDQGPASSSEQIKMKMLDESQKAMKQRLRVKVSRLQEANSHFVCTITKGNIESIPKYLSDILQTIREDSSEIYHLIERLESSIDSRNIYEVHGDGATSLNPVLEVAKEIRSKILELRRSLNYACAASDLTAPERRQAKKKVKPTISNESTQSTESKNDASDMSRTGSEKTRRYIKSETCNTPSQGAIKKRIRYRQKCLQNRALPDTDDDDEVFSEKRSVHKKLCRTRSVSEGSTSEVVVDESLVEKVVVPTQSTILQLNLENKLKESPVTVFVKTTRKLFTPIVESKFCESTNEEKEKSLTPTSENPVVHLPPLRSSPMPQKKLKDISPSIKLMMVKYNQKISEHEICKSGASSGSNSPVAWRSPTFERRVKAQTERYQEEIDKLSPLLGRREVQKSASAGLLHNKQRTVLRRKSVPQNVTKSSSLTMFSKMEEEKQKSLVDKKNSFKLELRHSPETRQKKLQKAKEEFLRLTPEPVKFPAKNRLSQISVESESSTSSVCPGALIKSASAGMINIEAEAYRQIDPEVHGDGYVSLPRNTKQPQEGSKFALSKIASKFRKVKMRRGKDKEKMNAVSALCRQSLVVDITGGTQKTEEEVMNVSSEDVSSTSSKASWIKRSKFFKK